MVLLLVRVYKASNNMRVSLGRMNTSKSTVTALIVRKMKCVNSIEFV